MVSRTGLGMRMSRMCIYQVYMQAMAVRELCIHQHKLLHGHEYSVVPSVYIVDVVDVSIQIHTCLSGCY